MAGFDRLISWLLEWVQVLRFWVIVPEDEHGIILAFGKMQRTKPKWYYPWHYLANGRFIGPGLHLKFFGWHDELTCSKAPDVNDVEIQSLMSKNGVKLQVSGTFLRAIKDPYKYFIKIGDEDDFMDSVAAVAIKTVVMRHDWPWEDVEVLEKEILDRSRKRLNEFGFKIYWFEFVNAQPGNALRLYQE